MKSDELKKRYEDSLEKIKKRYDTIEKQKKRLEKKREIFKDVEWINANNDKFLNDLRYDMIARDKYKAETGRDLYWDICDVNDALETVNESYNKLEELKSVSNNWKERYKKQLKLEDTISFDMPEVFKDCKEMLSEEWTKYDIQEREEMKKARAELSDIDFREKYSYYTEMNLTHTDEEFKKQNEREAENYIIDLYNRVKSEVGDVKTWDNIYLNGKALNGYIEGELGKVEVETILAGGWNVQRRHQRVILHKIK